MTPVEMVKECSRQIEEAQNVMRELQEKIDCLMSNQARAQDHINRGFVNRWED